MEDKLQSVGSLDGLGDGPSYSLPGVLQFVQHEWARFERERSKWDVERAELQAQLAFLQGERRGQENLKFDLVRRIKMLEYALRQERLKYHQLKYGTAPPACEDVNGSPGEPEPSTTTNTSNKLRPGRELLRQYLQEVNVTDSLLEVRDACRSRVLNASSDLNCFGGSDGMHSRSMSTRSCSFSQSDNNLSTGNLRIIRSTTSSPPPGTERPPGMVEFTSEFKPQQQQRSTQAASSAAGANPPFSQSTAGADMIETVCGDMPAYQTADDASSANSDAKFPEDDDADESDESAAKEEERFLSVGLSEEPSSWLSPAAPASTERKPQTSPTSPKAATLGDAVDPAATLSNLGLLPSRLQHASAVVDGACISRDRGDDKHPTETPSPGPRFAKRLSRTEAATAAGQLGGFDDDLAPGHLPGAGSATLSAAKQETSTLVDTASRHTPPGIAISDRESINVTDLISIGMETTSTMNDQAAIDDAKKVWAPKFSLHSHYDCVRSVAFHPSELVMLTASEDATVKIWNLEKKPVGKRNALPDIEPIRTLRGHRGAVLCTGFSPDGQYCFSGGVDGMLRQWNVCSADSETYMPYDRRHDSGACLVGHKDCIWDLSVHRVLPLVATASADGTACVWKWSHAAEPGNSVVQTLSSTQGDSGKAMVPTSVDFVHNEPGQVMASYQSGQAVLYDYETGKPVCSFTGIGGSQVNRVACHPTLSFSIAGLADRRIVYLDHRTGQVMFSMLAHLDSVSCLSIDPSGLYLLSGSHDCSLRLWMIESRACIQEMTAHRKKNDEAVFSVAFHPSKGYLASGGADSVAKVFA